MSSVKANIEDIKRLKELIKDNWSLCNFYDNCESEMMVAQTIHASVTNFESKGEAYSIEGKGIRSRHGNGIVDNGSAYSKLLSDGMFINEERGSVTVIFPTQALIDKLDEYFTRRKSAC